MVRLVCVLPIIVHLYLAHGNMINNKNTDLKARQYVKQTETAIISSSISQATNIKSCNDLYTGSFSNNIYSIMLPSGNIIQAMCTITAPAEAWTVLLRRFDGSVDFYRNWNSYKDGFGTLSGEFWIGLETLYQLTKTGSYIVRFEMEDHSAQSSFAVYDGFRVESESTDYTLTFNSYSGGTAVDGFAIHNGMKFTTKDRDNDIQSTSNCASTFTSAGWYRSCAYSDLFSAYMPGPQSTHKILRWSDQSQYKTGLSKIEMRMKKVQV